MKTHAVADAILSLLCITAIAVLAIIQFQWSPGNMPKVTNGKIAYGYHVAGTNHCAGGIANGTLSASEGCDDNNSTNGDGCSNTCIVESGWTCNSASPSVCQKCGNSTKEGTEGCDDGNTTASDGCSATCTVESGYTCNSASPNVCSTTCGDNTRAGSEGCDDGNTTASDGCSATCTVESGYTCNSASPNVCSATCGDGLKKGSEGCDDGNTTASDGCSATCTVESGYSCTGEPSTCNACGNKTVGGGEGCDDGNTTASDGCSATCTVESGYSCTGEPSTCTNKGIGGSGGGGETLPDRPSAPPTPPPPCGNGIREPEKCEECDNGRANSTSACSQKCTQLYCGDGIVSSYLKEECEGHIEEERKEDPVTKATVIRFWFIAAGCGTSCTLPKWTQKGSIWEYAMETGCKRDLSLPPCQGGMTERRIQVRPPFSCSASSSTASRNTTSSTPSRPKHCGDGILQAKEGEECDRSVYDPSAVSRIGKSTYGCSSMCKIAYCGDGIITPFAPLGEECDPKHPSYSSLLCTQNDTTLGCTEECRSTHIPRCVAPPKPAEVPVTNIQEPPPEEEVMDEEQEEEEEMMFEEEEKPIEEEGAGEDMLLEEEESVPEEEDMLLEEEESVPEEEDIPEEETLLHTAAPESPARKQGMSIVLLLIVAAITTMVQKAWKWWMGSAT